MKLEQRVWTKESGWKGDHGTLTGKADLVMVFGETTCLKESKALQEIREAYPGARIFGCSTAGEISGAQVYDDSINTTAIKFDETPIQMAYLAYGSDSDSFDAGRKLAAMLNPINLTHVLVLSSGLNVNGSQLVKGLSMALPPQVTMTGGLAGDKGRFQETLVICDDVVSNHAVVAVGLYGPCIKAGSASLGGWDSFGPERVVTKSAANVLYELDGKSALDLYKTYLGDHAKDLPGSALLFPLSMRTNNGAVVRTVLGMNEADQSLIFAGDIPEGSRVQLMRANFDRLIDGAVGAAEKSCAGSSPELALLISCVGRKIVLKQRVEEEVEGVRDVFGAETALTGFYSYGEISPFTPNATCELHNQTMTITTLSEVEKNAA